MTSEPSQIPRDKALLRAITPADLPVFYRHQADPASNSMAVVHPRSRDEFDAFWDRVLRDPGITARAIVVGRETVGHISCFQMDGLDAVGYWIAREHWGRGIATRALGLLLSEVPIRPLHARVARSNAASIRVLARCGFRLTVFRSAPADDRFPACEEALFVLD